MFAFENFPVYKLSEAFFEEVQAIMTNKSLERPIKDQLYRASTSIILNIAEGAGKHSFKDKKNFYAIARGSTQECVAVLRILKIQNIIDSQQYEKLHEQLTIISKMLSGLINRMLEVSNSKLKP